MSDQSNGGRRWRSTGFDPESEALPPMPGAWFLIPLSCALIAVLYTGQTWLTMSTHGHSFVRIFFWQLLVWGIWGALSPLVILLARRFPPSGRRSVRNILLHLLFSCLFGAVHLLPVAVATRVIHPYAPFPDPETLGEQYVGLVGSWLQVDLLLYWAAVISVHVYGRLRQRQIRESRLEAQLAQAKLEALKLQIRPHFLFNSLNAVAGMVRKNENAAAVRMIAGLSDLLRYVLEGSGSGQLAPLRDELAFTERYLQIQQARFGLRLAYAIEAGPEIADAQIPALLLQPLAENAVEHGVASVEGSCQIAVRARRAAGRLLVSVEDNGAGIDAEVARGIGLRNCEARLRTLYGEGASLRLEQRNGGGAAVLVDIPYEEVRQESR